MSATAVVFGYHDVGARCLPVLLAHGVDVALVVTHRDDPSEPPWFASVAAVAREHELPVVLPEAPEQVRAQVEALAPDFLFSFYYRHLLSPAMLAAARLGAYNLHGSLLPRYRGRAPVNWAVLHGERETGATLHEMTAKPDAGRIVDRMAVPILPDDTAAEVLRKVTVAAEIVVDRSLPALLAGTARLEPQALGSGSYFGRRRPEDGRIDWTRGARQIHDLVRAVAPPYPGAFTTTAGGTLRVIRTRVASEAEPPGPAALALDRDGHLVARCGAGGLLRLLDWTLDGERMPAARLLERLGGAPVRLEAAR